MNYNDVNSRIERIYLSIQINISDGTAEYLRLERVPNTTLSHFKANENEVLNKLIMIVSHISNLKDHLKNRIEIKGGSKQIIEDEINNNLHLQLIVDLNNAEKHGYPVKSKRSKLDPKFGNITSGLTLTGGDENYITIHPSGKIEKHGDVITRINADILSFKDEKICTFDELVDFSLKAWGKIISDNKIA